VSFTSQTAIIKKVILLNNTLTFGDLLLGNIIFLNFCCFRCVTHYVTVNVCINCSFLHLSLISLQRYTLVVETRVLRYYSLKSVHQSLLYACSKRSLRKKVNKTWEAPINFTVTKFFMWVPFPAYSIVRFCLYRPSSFWGQTPKNWLFPLTWRVTFTTARVLLWCIPVSLQT